MRRTWPSRRVWRSREALEAVRTIVHASDRSRALSALIPFAQDEEKQGAFFIIRNDWTALLHREALETRVTLVNNLCNFSEVIEVLGECDMMRGLARAILAVGRWWP